MAAIPRGEVDVMPQDLGMGINIGHIKAGVEKGS